MKRRGIYGKDILPDKEAEQILLELYKAGHGLADHIAEQVLGPESSREEREEVIQDTLLGMAAYTEKMAQWDLDERLRYMSTLVWKKALERSLNKEK